MPIPLSQLSTWSNQGGTTSAQQTHLSIRGLLENKYTGINTYLQGSYRNSTNIYGESDVDIVVEGSTVFNPSVLSNAFTIQQVLQPWTNLNANIRNALISNYGGIIVSNGKKAIKIKGGSGTGRINADVITGFNVNNGLLFYIPTEYRWVLNYPKQHYDNGTAKN
jgi:predicted nucleotidyltransferase